MKTKILSFIIVVLSLLVILPGCSGGTKNSSSTNITKTKVKEKEAGNQAQKESKEVKGNTSNANDFVISLPLIPGLAESPEKGAYVNLVKAIDEVYTEGSIKIEVNPIKRAQEILNNGEVDCYLPKIVTKYTDTSVLPYVISAKKNGQAAFVLYSNVNKKLTKEDLDNALKKGGDFPYKLVSTPSFKESFKYPYEISNSVEESMKKLDAGRIDGYIWAQEESDAYIKKTKLKSINRSKFYDFDDYFIIAKNEKSDKINKILVDCITKLESSGKLKELYSKIHGPYEEWQPSNMGW